MKVLREKNTGKVTTYCPIEDEAWNRHGWYAEGAVCFNPELVCRFGEEEANGYEVVEMTEEEFNAAIEE